jgi:hypothetical protein
MCTFFPHTFTVKFIHLVAFAVTIFLAFELVTKNYQNLLCYIGRNIYTVNHMI